MKTPHRFQFWKVFWVVLAFCIFFILLGALAMYMSPAAATKEINLRDKLTLPFLVYQVAGFIFLVFYYYITLNGFYKRFIERKSFFSYLRYCLAITAVLIVYYFASYYCSPEIAEKKKYTAGILVFSHTLATIFYLGIPLVFSYLVYLRDERKQRKILEEQKLQLEFEKSQANYNFLKAQINPHFLHNTLNFLYAKALPLSEDLSEGILTLSDIMRYALSQGNTRDGKAPLKDEIEHVQNVIKINQLRYNNKLNVRFDVEGAVNGAQIIPFALITIVENAFKHGDFKSVEHPITILIKIGKEGIYFSCSNRKKSGPKELGNGIGLENIRKRLELAYGEAFRFEVKEDAELYTTELTIYQL
ncbi:sensor histidine kinase [Flaviaesturariibacter flavus]|nr:histidine kinase [Flaviaesturariibacter flavus]